MRASDQDCASGGGWFSVVEHEHTAQKVITVTLCPAECAEHTQAGVAFVLERQWEFVEFSS